MTDVEIVLRAVTMIAATIGLALFLVPWYDGRYERWVLGLFSLALLSDGIRRLVI